jgi:NAD(P) transhydrogenase subunit alpha
MIRLSGRLLYRSGPMLIGVPLERGPGERRVAAIPASVSAYRTAGFDVVVEAGAGSSAGFTDDAYHEAGAELSDLSAVNGAGVVLRVGPPTAEEIRALQPGAILAGFLDPFVRGDLVAAAAGAEISAIALEAIPRTTLAQSMDGLSSQATVAGYAAVLLAASASPKFFPMLVTAAGTIPPARALILGVGVAGLQAIATAKRLGAIVSAYDIRTETREQVESLGARFVEAPTQKADEGGYATTVSDDIQQQQFDTLAPHVAESDIVITTAQIPGRRAPLLITADMVAAMHPGAVIVDGAAETGGNVEITEPGSIVVSGGVAVHGPINLPSEVPTDASRMLARNLQELLGRISNDGSAAIDLEDEVAGPATITHGGEIVSEPARRAAADGGST